MEQGTQLMRDSEFFPAAEKALGSRLRVIEQGNLGGSGGYARGQLESVRKGTATYALMMDDDVVCEPEGIIRAVTFADLARRPTIVGGHMFNIYSRSRLHSFGEIVQPWRFWWQTRLDGYSDWDFAARNLRSARWLHKRADVDFNGWFMCLIPRQVLERIGLRCRCSSSGTTASSGCAPGGRLPDGLAARRGGVAHPVVGQERRLGLAVLLPPAQPVRRRAAALAVRAGRPDGAGVSQPPGQAPGLHAVRHRAAAPPGLEDVLAGPHALHGQLPTKLGEVRALMTRFTDMQLKADRDDLPPVRRDKPPKKGKDDAEIPGRLSQLITAGLMPLRQLRPVRPMSREFPETDLTAMDAMWYRLARYDSAVVSMNDGTSAALYRRDPELFRDLLKRTVEIHQRLHREWPRLAEEYRSALASVTSPEAWEETFRPWTDGDDD
ncbi:MAG: glycosyltransferase [Nocardioides sp.]